MNADVLFWIDEGWIDYCIPQVYWEIGHPAADYKELVAWWAEHAANRPLYIGQDVNRTVKAKGGNQQAEKYALQRAEEAVLGSCFWDAASAAGNVDGYRDFLEAGYFRYPALMPVYEFINDGTPKKLKGVSVVEDENGRALVWLLDKNAGKKILNSPYRYVVYAFAKGEKMDLENPARILTVTDKTYYKLPAGLEGEYLFAVTVLDRMQNESKPVKYKVKL